MRANGAHPPGALFELPARRKAAHSAGESGRNAPKTAPLAGTGWPAESCTAGGSLAAQSSFPQPDRNNEQPCGPTAQIQINAVIDALRAVSIACGPPEQAVLHKRSDRHLRRVVIRVGRSCVPRSSNAGLSRNKPVSLIATASAIAAQASDPSRREGF